MAKSRVVPPNELSPKTLLAQDYIKGPLWIVRKKGDAKRIPLFKVRGWTWFAARDEACRETGLDRDQVDLELDEGEQSPHG